MSPRAWICALTVGGIFWLIVLGVVAGWDLASRGELVVLHLGGHP